jgi:tetratricopeptide (TPR) repeat protein
VALWPALTARNLCLPLPFVISWLRFPDAGECAVAGIFVSFTSSDRRWAFWIGQELETLGHAPRIHEWEISAGGDIPKWMEESLEKADHCLLVVSKTYLTKPYASWERRAAQWAAASTRPNFALPVFIEACEPPILLAHLKRCALNGLSENEARATLAAFLKPAQRPTAPQAFPGDVVPWPKTATVALNAFPGNAYALSNIPLHVPLHFLGRDDALAAVEAALKLRQGRVAVTALHGLRGVGKSTLAAAFAERHRGNYRATWWIRAETESTIRADLVGLGLRLGWVGADDKEEPAVAAVLQRLCDDGEGILLIFDNAGDPNAITPYLPHTGATKVLVTSNSHAWRAIAAPVEIRVWPKNVGAEYLIARTGCTGERTAAETLSESLGGLPLAHEQAAAYCERLEVLFAEYRRRFEKAPTIVLGDARYAPPDYRLTVVKTFALAIGEAAKLHAGAEPLIVHAALLAPEPIPLFLFAEGREQFGEPLKSALADNGLDEAVAALRKFALVERETIKDERDPATTTDSIRLHRLVRDVAAARRQGKAKNKVVRALIAAMAAVYPKDISSNPKTWPRARRLDRLALAWVEGDAAPPGGSKRNCTELLNLLAQYRLGPLASYTQAELLYRRALAINENTYGPNHPRVGADLISLGLLLKTTNRLGEAELLYRRALAIMERSYGPNHPLVAIILTNLAALKRATNRLSDAAPLVRMALAIFEKSLGPNDPNVATALNSLAELLRATQQPSEPLEPLYRRALAIDETSYGPDHPNVARDLNNLAQWLRQTSRLSEAEPLLRRALAIEEKTFDPDHPEVATGLNNLAVVLEDIHQLSEAERLYRRALTILQRSYGRDDPRTVSVCTSLARLGLKRRSP